MNTKVLVPPDTQWVVDKVSIRGIMFLRQIVYRNERELITLPYFPMEKFLALFCEIKRTRVTTM